MGGPLGNKNAMKPRTTPEPPPVPGARWIALTKGYFALVDEADFAWASQWTWQAIPRPNGKKVYAFRHDDPRPREYMHRGVLKAPAGLEVDHIDAEPLAALPGLDNRRANLRLATTAQNGHNRGRPSNNTSGFKGVFRNGGRWVAQIMSRCRRECLGSFATAEAAARAYDAAALRLHGPFAKLNFGGPS